MRPHKFRDLIIWQKARHLVKDVYSVTNDYPVSEVYGIQSQARRASVSIAANIAEGSGKGTNKDFNNFLNIAKGSLYELQTLIILSNDLGYLNVENSELIISQCNEIEKMLYSFQSQLLQTS